MLSCDEIRDIFIEKLERKEFVTDKTGVDMLEIIGESFIADKESIFGTVNKDYVQREIEWYESCSLNVNDIPGGPPKIWQQVATEDGRINSNYGYLVWHPDNYMQYHNCLNELIANPLSRRAIVIYTRPSIWVEYNQDGMSDFICTNTVSYLIRDNKLHAHVNMRSNDVVFGYKNDRFWQKFVLDKLAKDLEIESGDVYWTATSLHIYERHFHLVK